jgi:hypothetical protein
MAPGRDGWRVAQARQYGVFNPAERRLSTPTRRLPWLVVVVVLATAAWALVAAVAAVGMQFARAGWGGVTP